MMVMVRYRSPSGAQIDLCGKCDRRRPVLRDAAGGEYCTVVIGRRLRPEYDCGHPAHGKPDRYDWRDRHTWTATGRERAGYGASVEREQQCRRCRLVAWLPVATMASSVEEAAACEEAAAERTAGCAGHLPADVA